MRNGKKYYRGFLVAVLAGLVIVALLTLTACSSQQEVTEGREHETGREEAGGEHREPGESSATAESESGEESGQQYALTDTYDRKRAGARLTISYDPESNAFTGNVVNTTDATLNRVRVEVHLSNGVELGPTTPVNLVPGQSAPVTLPATEQPFATWSAHPEVGGGSNTGGEHEAGEDGEHGNVKSSGEHSRGVESGEHRGG